MRFGIENMNRRFHHMNDDELSLLAEQDIQEHIDMEYAWMGGPMLPDAQAKKYLSDNIRREINKAVARKAGKPK